MIDDIFVKSVDLRVVGQGRFQTRVCLRMTMGR